MQPEPRAHEEAPAAAPRPRAAYQKPELSVLARITATGGDDCGTLDLPIGDNGFGCALS